MPTYEETMNKPVTLSIELTRGDWQRISLMLYRGLSADEDRIMHSEYKRTRAAITVVAEAITNELEASA